MNRLAVRRVLAAAVLGLAGSVLLSAPAWAHVSVSPGTGSPGGYVTESFQVPNERDDATTTAVTVDFPTDHPLASVSVEPVPGWTATVRTAKLAKPIRTDDGEVTEAVSSITWTGGAIAAGQFQRFTVAMGPLPESSGTLTFKALQTYSDGQVVRWIDVAAPGQPEPDHPAPTVSVVDTAAPPAAPPAQSDPLALVLGGCGLLAGLAALIVVVFGRRRPNTAQPDPAAKPERPKQKTGV